MNEYDMQDDATRRKVFWLLQRLTSLSLWKAKYDAFRVFADTYGAAVNTWPANDPDALEADHLKIIYEILGYYAKGLPELANGRRFVWRVDQPLERAVDRFNELAQYFYRNPKYWESGSQFAPYPPKVDALYQMMRASEFQLDDAPLEVVTDLMLASLRTADILLDPAAYERSFYKLDYPTFPDVLPEVPDSPGPVIRSGQTVPCDGIWEPVTIEQRRVLGVMPVGADGFGNDGCFNYFVAETEAPSLSLVDTVKVTVSAGPTHWRLLWEDTRYRDGVIPNESQYFLQPKAKDSSVS